MQIVRQDLIREAAIAYTERFAEPTGVVDESCDHGLPARRIFDMRIRPPHAPHAFYHVTLRGNRQQPIFHDALDRERWQRLLADTLERYGARLHLYCWMTNHIHMVLECGVTPIFKTMHLVAGAYARTFNLKYAHVGHLFGGRYGSRLVDSDAYLLQLIRYIHLNPVAGGLVRTPIEYRWSSHRRYVLADEEEWLTTAFVLSLFHHEPSVARRRIAAFIDACETQDRSCEVITPSSATQAVPTAWSPYLTELVAAACRRFGVDAAMLAGPSHCHLVVMARAWVVWAAQRQGIATLADIARHLRHSPSTLSRGVVQYRRDFEHRSPPL